MEENKINIDEVLDLINHPEKLPERAYTTLPSNPCEVIIVLKGEKGYYHYQTYPTPELAAKTAKYCNEIFKATPEETEALMALSMSG